LSGGKSAAPAGMLATNRIDATTPRSLFMIPPTTIDPVTMFADDINRCGPIKSNMQAAAVPRLQFASVRDATSVFDRSKFELL
jgi:hypothetical protein